MKNVYASMFVLLFLAACSAHVWTNTHARLGDGDSAHWDDYVRHGGAFRGRP